MEGLVNCSVGIGLGIREFAEVYIEIDRKIRFKM